MFKEHGCNKTSAVIDMYMCSCVHGHENASQAHVQVHSTAV